MLCAATCVMLTLGSCECLSCFSWYSACHICCLHSRDRHGTTSTRCMYFDRCCRLLHHPRPRHV